jgi:MFS family permease
VTGTHAATRASSLRKVIVASLIGTSLEWYDFFLYSTAAAVVFNRLFFPSVSPVTGTLLAFTTAAVGFAARPLGGIVFGHFGDRHGRKRVLVTTLLMMGVATVLIGALPTCAAIGVAAPLLLAALRFIQGLALGGEWGGAVIMTIEHGAGGRRGFYASWAQVGVPLGNLLAAGALGLLGAVMSESAFLSWGWRLPFFFSGLLVLAGLWIRLTIAESPLFAEVERTGVKAKMPLVEVLRRHPRQLLVAMAARIGTDVAFYTFTIYSLVFITGTVGRERAQPVRHHPDLADPAAVQREDVDDPQVDRLPRRPHPPGRCVQRPHLPAGQAEGHRDRRARVNYGQHLALRVRQGRLHHPCPGDEVGGGQPDAVDRDRVGVQLPEGVGGRAVITGQRVGPQPEQPRHVERHRPMLVHRLRPRRPHRHERADA